MVVIVDVTEEQLWERIDPSLEFVGMTREAFLTEGEADTLVDPNIRDLWLAYAGLLTEE